jgi:hypothetical protein
MGRKLLSTLLLLLPLACSSGEAPPRPAPVETWTLPLPAAAEAEVVATVDGAPITISEVEALAKAGGLTAEQALEQAIEDQLVLAGALAHSHPQDLSDAFKSAAASHLITRRFEPQNQPEAIPDEILRTLYEELQRRDYSEPHLADKKFIFSHGQWRAAVQMVVTGDSMPDAESASTVESLLRLVRDRYSIGDEPGQETFRAHAWHVQNSYVSLRFEQLPPLSLEPDENTYRLGGEFDADFVKRLFEFAAVGSHSEIFQTRFGLHWVFLSAVIPERRSAFEEVREELRASIADSHRVSSFQDWLIQLRRDHGVTAPDGRK